MEELKTLDYCIIVPIEVFNMHGHYTESKHVIAMKINANGSFYLHYYYFNSGSLYHGVPKVCRLVFQVQTTNRGFHRSVPIDPESRRLKTENLHTPGHLGHTA